MFSSTRSNPLLATRQPLSFGLVKIKRPQQVGFGQGREGYLLVPPSPTKVELQKMSKKEKEEQVAFEEARPTSAVQDHLFCMKKMVVKVQVDSENANSFSVHSREEDLTDRQIADALSELGYEVDRNY